MPSCCPTVRIRIIKAVYGWRCRLWTARTAGQKPSDQPGQPVVIDNRPGAGGVVAGEVVNKAPTRTATIAAYHEQRHGRQRGPCSRATPFDRAQSDFAPIRCWAPDIATVAPPTTRASRTWPSC